MIGPALSSSPSGAIYLDYHATTPTDPRVAEVVLRYLVSDFGNASSSDHSIGKAAADAVDQARNQIRQLFFGPGHLIVFTSGATESINLAIKGYCDGFEKSVRVRIVLSPLEHSAVLDTCSALARNGRAEVTFATVDSSGRIDLDELSELAQHADLVCLMSANNEIGTVYPIADISQICQEAGAALLCDASQSAGKIIFDAPEVDFVALSAHKMYGPKGVGALLLRTNRSIITQMHGGGHQRGIRSGTINVPGIVGFGEACRLRKLEMASDEARIRELRDLLASTILHELPETVVNGDPMNKLSGNLHISVPGVINGAVLARLWGKLAISTGAACSSGVETPSHVLRAVNLPRPLIEGAFRFGVGKFSTEGEIKSASALFVNAVREVQAAIHA